MRTVNRKQVSAVALEHNFARTACSLPCVVEGARPPTDHAVLVLVLFSHASAAGHSWGRTQDGSCDPHCLPWELWVWQAFLQLPLEPPRRLSCVLCSFFWCYAAQLQHHHRVRVV